MRLGIVTHYYESSNYGGNLQAYSLCKFLEKVGHDARQVSLRLDFEKLGEHATKSSVLAKVFKHIKKDFLPKAIDYTIIKFSKAKVLRWTKKQRKSFESFSKAEIPHTTTVFLKENIEACVDEFDIFITGSDQVWNPVYYMPAFFLTFVPPAKRKISYAASVATEKLTAEQASIFKEHLKDFYAISVREDSAVDLIQPLAPVPVKHTLDPTLLLEASDWDAVCSERIIPEDYVFCYFLGYNQKERKLAKRYAKKHNLKLVTIPMINYGLSVADVGFGEAKMNNASVQDFISLIKHAKRVFTDSFHASVFSIIYNTPFFVFQRGKSGEMSSRITSLLSLFSLEERFCTYDKSSLSYLEQLDGEGLHPSYEKYNEKKKESIAFLTESLG